MQVHKYDVVIVGGGLAEAVAGVVEEGVVGVGFGDEFVHQAGLLERRAGGGFGGVDALIQRPVEAEHGDTRRSREVGIVRGGPVERERRGQLRHPAVE